MDAMDGYGDRRRTPREPPGRDRRRGQRARVVWQGSYLVVDPPASLAWNRCHLVDIGEGGAAIEILGDDLEVGQQLLVRLDPHPAYDGSGLQLRARVVNRRDSNGGRIFGLSFEALVASQRDHFREITSTARRNAQVRRVYSG